MMSLLQLDLFKNFFRDAPPAPAPRAASAPPKPAPKPPTAAPVRARHLAGEDPALAARCVVLLAPLNCPALAARVRVRWNPRMRSTAGLARVHEALITLNPRLREFGDEEVDRTLRHELAHLLAQHRAGRRRIPAHGAEWRKACADLGAAGERRCHDLPLPRRKMSRPYVYVCPSCKTEVHRTRPFKRPSACLPCCRAHNNGRYDNRFRFVKASPPAGKR